DGPQRQSPPALLPVVLQRGHRLVRQPGGSRGPCSPCSPCRLSETAQAHRPCRALARGSTDWRVVRLGPYAGDRFALPRVRDLSPLRVGTKPLASAVTPAKTGLAATHGAVSVVCPSLRPAS